MHILFKSFTKGNLLFPSSESSLTGNVRPALLGKRVLLWRIISYSKRGDGKERERKKRKNQSKNFFFFKDCFNKFFCCYLLAKFRWNIFYNWGNFLFFFPNRRNMSIVFLFQVDIISGTKKPAEEEAKKRKSRFDQAIPVAGVTVMKNSVPPPTLTSVPSGNKTTISAFGSLKKTK